MGSLYRYKYELVFVQRVGAEQHFNAVELGKHGRNRTNVWDYASFNSLHGSRSDDLDFHPTVKPIPEVEPKDSALSKRRVAKPTICGLSSDCLAGAAPVQAVPNTCFSQ